MLLRISKCSLAPYGHTRMMGGIIFRGSILTIIHSSIVKRANIDIKTNQNKTNDYALIEHKKQFVKTASTDNARLIDKKE